MKIEKSSRNLYSLVSEIKKLSCNLYSLVSEIKKSFRNLYSLVSEIYFAACKLLYPMLCFALGGISIIDQFLLHPHIIGPVLCVGQTCIMGPRRHVIFTFWS